MSSRRIVIFPLAIAIVMVGFRCAFVLAGEHSPHTTHAAALTTSPSDAVRLAPLGAPPRLTSWWALSGLFFGPLFLLGARWLYRNHRLLVSHALYSQRAEASTRRRQLFRDTVMPLKAPPRNHTHPLAASSRTCVSAFAEHYCALVGTSAYYVQQGLADLRHERDGSRVYYWSKDLLVTPAGFSPDENATCVLVDVDFYVDMNSFLNEAPGDVLVYTISPEMVSSSGEISFTFNEKSEIVYSVSGGAFFTHPLYSYYGDACVAVTWGWTSPVVSTYLVDTLRTSEHRALTLLNQTARFSGLRGWLAWACYATGYIKMQKLRHLNVVEDEFLVLDIQSSDGISRSLGRPNRYNSSVMPVASHDSLVAMARNSAIPMTMHMVQPYLAVDNKLSIGERISCTTVVDYMRSKHKHRTPDRVSTGLGAVSRYQFRPENTDDSAPTALSAFMSPIIPGSCYSPDICLNNEVVAVQARVLEVQSKVLGPLTVHPNTLQFAKEFVEFLVPVPNEGFPTDEVEVFARQPRPSQRRILEEATWFPSFINMVTSFLKREAYSKPGHPRVISTIQPDLKLRYSQFCYPLYEFWNNHSDCGIPGAWSGRTIPWFASGKTPKIISSMVASLAENATWWLDSDLSRMDGRKSQVLRDLEMMVWLRFLRKEHHDEISELHRSTYRIKGVTKNGFRYRSDTDQRSGVPDTLLFNTSDTAFIAYIAFRLMGKEPFQAWKSLGLYCGDDGGTPDVDSVCLVKAAETVGQVLTVVDAPRGGEITFLARIYGPNVWSGDPNSMCDLPRQLTKFHSCVSLCNNSAGKLVEKTMAFALTDAETPVFSDLISAVQRLVGEGRNNIEALSLDQKRALLPWGSTFELVDQYPNHLEDWMWDKAVVNLKPWDFDFAGFQEYCARARNFDDLLNMPPFATALPPVPQDRDVVVNGEVVPAIEVAADTPAPDVQKCCFNFQSTGKCSWGARCKYAHVAKGAVAASGKSLDRPAVNTLGKTEGKHVVKHNTWKPPE